MFVRRRSTRQKAPTLTRQLVMLAVFFGLMLTPMMSSMATAFEADRAQALAQGDEATEPVDEPTDPVEEPTEPVDETLVEEATEVPTEQPTEVMLETGMVTVWKGECPIDNFDPYQASADQLSSTCSSNGTATFQVTDTSGASPQSGPSGSSFDVLAGDVSIGEELPSGYQQPVVVCQSDMSGVSQPSVSNAAVSIQVNSEEMVVCTFYNIPEGNEVTVYKWDCPEGTDPTGTEEYLLTECNTQHTGIPFDLTDANGSHPMDSQSDGTTWNDVVRDTEDVTITETIPSGYGDPVVYCYSLLPDETDPALVTSTGGTVAIPNLGDGPWNYYCNWFNIPEGDTYDGDTGAIEIEYRECADGYTFLDGTNEDNLDQMLLDCAQVDGVEFTIDQGGPDGTTQETGFYGESHVSFLEVPVGMRTVTQTVAFANTYVVCEGIVSNGGPETGAMVMPVANGSIEWNLINEEIAYCNWFVMPDGDGNEVTVYKWDCPAGTDPTGTLEYLGAECDTEHLNIPISLTDDGGPHDTTTQANGTTWNNVVAASGTFTITEDLPDGYGDPVVYCYMLLPDETESTLVTSTGGTITANVPTDAQWNYYCNWYNIPAGDGNEVTVYKWDCPIGTDPTGTEEYLLTECNTQHTGIPFDLTDANGSHPMDSQSDGTTWNDVVRDTEDVTITETIPSGYGDPVVYCYSLLPDETDPALVTSTGGTVTIPNFGDAQWNYYCNWFNIPYYDHQVWVYKWICPDGTVPGDHDEEWFFENCTEALDGIEYRLDYADGWSYGTTSGGQYVWDGLTPGPIGLQEEIPADYEEPVVFCSTDGNTYEQFPTTNGYITYDDFGMNAEGNTAFVCHWFNIYGGPGEITVYKWTCPEGYDPHAWGVDPYADCVEGPNGITFTNDGPDGYSSQTDTGDSVEYAVYWGGLEPGTYTVEEMVPDGIGSVFVWDCYGQRTGELRPTPLTTEPSVTLDVHAGEAIICHWFNVPEDPDGKLTVIKFECSTKTWVSEVDCEVYEGGQTFDLAQWNGSSWGVIATNTTDGFGRYTWYDLEPGEYWVAEQGREWCHLSSEGLSEDGNWLNVTENQETVVKVYNCTGEPGKPGKTPTKYPNTGVPASFREEWRLAA